MTLESVTTLGLDMADLSSERPVSVRREFYGGARTQERAPFSSLAQRYPAIPLYIPPENDFILPHNHVFCEVVLVGGGEGTHVVGDGVLALREGDVLVIPEGATHCYENMRDLEFVSLFYMGAWLAEDVGEIWKDTDLVRMFLAGALFNLDKRQLTFHFRLDPPCFEACLRELSDIAKEQSGSMPNRPFLRGCLLKLLVMLSQAHRDTFGVGAVAGMRAEVWHVLDRVERALEAGEPVQVRALAAAQSMSPEHLTREFKRATGLSVMQYFQRRRMMRAMRQLLTPGVSATDVAYALGFADYAHFRRRFKAFFGESPAAYREARLRPARGFTSPWRG